eukprot:TRINITY_DN743_c1_g1_i1.p1 TRINITY_DN743_c1_g1~~TRINITY_DN743_c1_g1_i1.p1  ORF type:complete len:214 (-),score=20.94 TRINITY_DN743_c1_g1_i1:174-815(-)
MSRWLSMQGKRLSFLASYEGPDSGEYEQNNIPSLSCSMSWPSSGPSAAEVPMSSMCREIVTQEEESGAQAHDQANAPSAPARPCQKNPMPDSGSRRDASGCLSVGSQGHEEGLCKGPCKDIRAGRGCTWGKKCKKCHFPHPEVSSSSIRCKKTRAQRMAERMNAMGLDRDQQVQFFMGGSQEEFQQGQQDEGFAMGYWPATYEADGARYSISL